MAHETTLAPELHEGEVVSLQSARHLVGRLVRDLDRLGIRYCHWKSNIRLANALAGAEDIDLLVAREHVERFQALLGEHRFKPVVSRAGIGHPGVFHALALDEETAQVMHVHAYVQIVSGDSLVKNYRLPIEDALLTGTRRMHGVAIPAAEAELVLFVMRTALKHCSLPEIALVNRDYDGEVELAWLAADADMAKADAFRETFFPEVEPELFRDMMAAVGNRDALLRRIVLGWRIAWRLRGLRRMGTFRAMISRYHRVAVQALGRFFRRRDMALQSGGMIVALVGPKATGKSTLQSALVKRLGGLLDVRPIHAGKPPATPLTFLPRLLVPLARRLFPSERPGEYERREKREAKRYSLLYVLRMTILAYDRRRLLQKAQRAATAGTIIVSDRYPSLTVGAIDSSCFDAAAVAACADPLKRWLMEKERALYRGLPAAGLILRLVAPINTAINRDASRDKEGGPDADAVARRWDMETSADFGGTPAIEVDTTRPLDETIRNIVRAVWKAL
jgi:hypothetical protein